MTNEVINGKTKHIMSKIAYLRYQLKLNSYKLLYVQTENNLADIFTKAVNSNKFQSHTRLLGLGGVLKSSLSDKSIDRNPPNHASRSSIDISE